MKRAWIKNCSAVSWEFTEKDRELVERIMEVCTASENSRFVSTISRQAAPRRIEVAQMRDVQD